MPHFIRRFTSSHLLILLLLIGITLFLWQLLSKSIGIVSNEIEIRESKTEKSELTLEEAEISQAINVVSTFGKTIQTVSAPAQQLPEVILEKYKNLVSPSLLQTWTQNPAQAPKREFSSPWPERIEINNVLQQDVNSFEVTGSLIWITSREITSEADENFFKKDPVLISVYKQQGKWVINSFQIITKAE